MMNTIRFTPPQAFGSQSNDYEEKLRKIEALSAKVEAKNQRLEARSEQKLRQGDIRGGLIDYSQAAENKLMSDGTYLKDHIENLRKKIRGTDSSNND